MDATSWGGKTTSPGVQARRRWILSARRHPSRHLRVRFIHLYSSRLSFREGWHPHPHAANMTGGDVPARIQRCVSGWHGARLFTSNTTFLSSPATPATRTPPTHPNSALFKSSVKVGSANVATRHRDPRERQQPAGGGRQVQQVHCIIWSAEVICYKSVERPQNHKGSTLGVRNESAVTEVRFILC